MKRHISRLAVAGMAIIATATAVHAAEPLPPIYPIYPNIIFDGWYGGINGGYRFAEGSYSSDPLDFKPPFFWKKQTLPGFDNDVDLDSWIFGLHVGHNIRKGQNWLVGFEADANWGEGEDDGASSASWSKKKKCFWSDKHEKEICKIRKKANFEQDVEVELNWQASLRGRIGYITGSWLWFTTFGVAFVDYDFKQTADLDANLKIFWWEKNKNKSFVHDNDGTAIGPVVGVGFEKAFGSAGQWSLGAEALWEFLGDSGQLGGIELCSKHGDCAIQKAEIDDLDAVKLRVRLSRSFGAAPVVAPLK